MQSLNLKKFFLYLLIASVAFSALLGIGVILFGNFGETESKILLTTLIVTITSILGLACGAYLETKRGKILPVGGIILAILSAILWAIFIWGNVGNERVFVQTALSATLLAASFSHISLLSIANLDRKFRWALYAAHFSVWSLTAILLWIIWAELKGDSELLTRTIGVLSIVIAALTIITPIFHWLSRQTPKAEEIDAEIARLRSRIEELEKQRGEIPNDEN
jgi:hypothetical protein